NTKQASTDSPFSKILDHLRGVPFYVGGFVLCALATNLVLWPDWFLSSIKNLTQWMLWIALAAIGINIRISQVLHQGRGALVPALGMFVFQILLVLGWLVFLKS
ncbi:MAG: putative sulfate exporter family transporter, partial [Bacteroidota bacterium]